MNAKLQKLNKLNEYRIFQFIIISHWLHDLISFSLQKRRDIIDQRKKVLFSKCGTEIPTIVLNSFCWAIMAAARHLS